MISASRVPLHVMEKTYLNSGCPRFAKHAVQCFLACTTPALLVVPNVCASLYFSVSDSLLTMPRQMHSCYCHGPCSTVKDLLQEDADSVDGNEAPPDYLVPTPRRFDVTSSEQQVCELREVLRF